MTKKKWKTLWPWQQLPKFFPPCFSKIHRFLDTKEHKCWVNSIRCPSIFSAVPWGSICISVYSEARWEMLSAHWICSLRCWENNQDLHRLSSGQHLLTKHIAFKNVILNPNSMKRKKQMNGVIHFHIFSIAFLRIALIYIPVQFHWTNKKHSGCPGFPILLSKNTKIVMIKCKINARDTVKNDWDSDPKS